MCAWFARLRERRGTAALEFALCMPILLALCVGVAEFGRMWSQTLTLEKSLVAGVGYAARATLPLSGAATGNFENLVKRGSLDPGRPLLLEGWAAAGATTGVTTRSFSQNGVVKQVVRGTASVPYTGIFPGLLHLARLDGLRIEASYEQVHIGN